MSQFTPNINQNFVTPVGVPLKEAARSVIINNLLGTLGVASSIASSLPGVIQSSRNISQQASQQVGKAEEQGMQANRALSFANEQAIGNKLRLGQATVQEAQMYAAHQLGIMKFYEGADIESYVKSLDKNKVQEAMAGSDSRVNTMLTNLVGQPDMVLKLKQMIGEQGAIQDLGEWEMRTRARRDISPTQHVDDIISEQTQGKDPTISSFYAASLASQASAMTERIASESANQFAGNLEISNKLNTIKDIALEERPGGALSSDPQGYIKSKRDAFNQNQLLVSPNETQQTLSAKWYDTLSGYLSQTNPKTAMQVWNDIKDTVPGDESFYAKNLGIQVAQKFRSFQIQQRDMIGEQMKNSLNPLDIAGMFAQATNRYNEDPLRSDLSKSDMDQLKQTMVEANSHADRWNRISSVLQGTADPSTTISGEADQKTLDDVFRFYRANGFQAQSRMQLYPKLMQYQLTPGMFEDLNNLARTAPLEAANVINEMNKVNPGKMRDFIDNGQLGLRGRTMAALLVNDNVSPDVLATNFSNVSDDDLKKANDIFVHPDTYLKDLGSSFKNVLATSDSEFGHRAANYIMSTRYPAMKQFMNQATDIDPGLINDARYQFITNGAIANSKAEGSLGTKEMVDAAMFQTQDNLAEKMNYVHVGSKNYLVGTDKLPYFNGSESKEVRDSYNQLLSNTLDQALPLIFKSRVGLDVNNATTDFSQFRKSEDGYYELPIYTGQMTGQAPMYFRFKNEQDLKNGLDAMKNVPSHKGPPSFLEYLAIAGGEGQVTEDNVKGPDLQAQKDAIANMFRIPGDQK